MDRFRRLRKYFFGIIAGIVCQGELLPLNSALLGVCVGIVFGVLWTSLFELPWFLRRNYLLIVRDSLLVFAVNAAFRFASTQVAPAIGVEFIREAVPWVLAFSVSLFMFGVLTVITRKHVLTHLGYVLLCFWLLSLSQLYLEGSPIGEWVLALLVDTAAMWLGYGIARALRAAKRRQEVASSAQSQTN